MAEPIRAKAYQLNADGTWTERGVGEVQVECMEVAVLNPETNTPVCERARLSADVVYRLQQDLLLPLSDEGRPAGSVLLAFQTSADASAALEMVRAAIAAVAAGYELPERPRKNKYEGMARSPPPDKTMSSTILPKEVTYANLTVIAAKLEECVTPPIMPGRRDILAKVLRLDYVHKLLAVFDKLDDLDDRPGLHAMYRIFSALFQLGSPELVNQLTEEATLPTVIAALEHHPKRPHINHRAILHSIKLINPLNLEPQLTRLLHNVNMLLYLKDSVLPVGTDDVSLEVIRNQAVVNRNNAVLWIVGEDARVRALNSRIRTDSKDVLSVLRFFEELLQGLKTVAPDELETVFLRLIRCDALSNVCAATRHENVKVRQCCSDIVNHFVAHDTSLLRGYIMSEPSMLTCFVEQAVRETDTGVQSQWQEIARIVLETKAQRERYIFGGSAKVYDIEEGFYAMVYRNDGSLLDPLLWGLRQTVKIARAGEVSEVQVRINAAQQRLADNGFYSAAPIINTCLGGHGARACEWALQVGLAEMVCDVAKLPSTQKSPKRLLACLWVLRGLVDAEDAAIHNVLAASMPLDALMPLVMRRGLVGSAMLCMLNSVWSLNRRPLVRRVAMEQGAYLRKIAGTHVGEHFMKRHEKNVEDGVYGDDGHAEVADAGADVAMSPVDEPVQHGANEATTPRAAQGVPDAHGDGLGGLLNAYEEGGGGAMDVDG